MYADDPFRPAGPWNRRAANAQTRSGPLWTGAAPLAQSLVFRLELAERSRSGNPSLAGLSDPSLSESPDLLGPCSLIQPESRVECSRDPDLSAAYASGVIQQRNGIASVSICLQVVKELCTVATPPVQMNRPLQFRRPATIRARIAGEH